MKPDTVDMSAFLAHDEVVDWRDGSVRSQAQSIINGMNDEVQMAKRLFEWVRDEIPHSKDIESEIVSCSASQVLKSGTGICYAKSHLLAAFLRSISIPCGFCYQVLRSQYPGRMVLHGLNGIHLTSIERWIRVDPRGNTNGVDAQFNLKQEQLAFQTDPNHGEFIYKRIFPAPAMEVVHVLKKYSSRSEMWPNLPQCISAQQGGQPDAYGAGYL